MSGYQVLGPIAVAAVDDSAREARIRLAAPLSLDAIERHFADGIETCDEVEWDPRAEAVVARRVRRFHALALEERPLRDLPAGATEAAMLAGIAVFAVLTVLLYGWVRNRSAKV